MTHALTSYGRPAPIPAEEARLCDMIAEAMASVILEQTGGDADGGCDAHHFINRGFTVGEIVAHEEAAGRIAREHRARAAGLSIWKAAS